MNSFANKGIKDIIAEFPEVGSILEDYGIGCGPCTVGICQLSDVVEIHSIPPGKEKEMMARIAAVIKRESEPAALSTPSNASADQEPHVFSSPMQLLVEEHCVIKQLLGHIPLIVATMDLHSPKCADTIASCIDFIRTYADRLHHGKEEDILFTYFDHTEKIFQVIYEDHRTARSYVKKMNAALEREDSAELRHYLSAYAQLLDEHIRKEDEILFPWLDRRLKEEQVFELEEKFLAADKHSGADPEKYKNFLRLLEEKLK